MRLILLISLVILLVFGIPATAQETPGYLDLYLEDSVTDQEFFLDWSATVNDRLDELHDQYLWFPVSTDNPIKVVICNDPEFCTQFVDEDSLLWFFFVWLESGIPISGTSGQASVNATSPTWQSWTDSEKRIFMTGEVFRVIESRLNVWANEEEGDDYISWDVPVWFWLGSPIVWASSIFPEDGAIVLSDIEEIYNQTEIEPAQLQYQDEDQYWSSVYVVSQLITQSNLSSDAFFEYDYLVGVGDIPQSEAFEQVFGIEQAEFEDSFE